MMAEKGVPPLEEGNVVPGSLGSDERLRLIAAIEGLKWQCFRTLAG